MTGSASQRKEMVSMEKRGMRRKGSYTVEAALLMSVILMVLFLMIQMNLFLTDQVRMTAVLAEDCTYGKDEIIDRDRWFGSQCSGFFYLKPAQVRRNASDRSVTVTYPADPVYLGYGYSIDPGQSCTRKHRKPAAYLRKIQAIKSGTA